MALEIVDHWIVFRSVYYNDFYCVDWLANLFKSETYGRENVCCNKTFASPGQSFAIHTGKNFKKMFGNLKRFCRANINWSFLDSDHLYQRCCATIRFLAESNRINKKKWCWHSNLYNTRLLALYQSDLHINAFR